MVISNPAISAGGTYTIGNAISEIQVTVSNEGNTDYNGTITADITIGTSTTSVSETPSTPITSGSTYTFSVTGTDIPSFPSINGNFDVCAEITTPDSDASNNQGCESYVADWPAGIIATENNRITAFYANDNIVLTAENATGEVLNVSVYSITGREVVNANVSLSNQVSIPFSNVANGVYILKIGDNAVKFVK